MLGTQAETTPNLMAPVSSSSTSSHRQKPSASSISSSSGTSIRSKTAAFFGDSHVDNAIRPAANPARSSTSSLQRDGSRRSRTSHEDDSRPRSGEEDGLGDVHMTWRSEADSSSSNHASASAALAASQARQSSHFHSDVGIGRSVSSSSALSTGGRRSWIDFEGKPIVPLPSPAIALEDRQLGDVAPDLDHGYGQLNVSDDHGGSAQTLSIDTSMRRAPSTSNAAVAQHVAKLAAEQEQKAALVESPKTLSFFGGKGVGHRPRKSDVELSPVSPSPLRIASDVSSLRAPSRYPSITAHHPRPLLWSDEGNDDDDDEGQAVPTLERVADRPPQISPLAEVDAQPLIPSAFISPPTPVLGIVKEGSADVFARELQSSGFQAPRNGYGRHSHGPSENVTSSSILPHAELVQLADRSESAYRAGMANNSNAFAEPIQRDSATGTPRPTAVAAGVESEDEGAQRIGSFVIERVLGTGAFSQVVLARRIRCNANAVEVAAASQSGGLVALKMLEKEPCRQNERMRVSWVREVEVLKHILHPNIVRFLTSYSTTRHHVLVLESVEGGELFEYLAQEQRELAEREWLVRRLFGELAGAVGWMHSINLVHRDIKLENIILTRHFRRTMAVPLPDNLPDAPLVKLSDFGLSRFIDPASPLLETRCGSEEYAAPELIIGKRYDGRQTDVWALGVVLYALLSGSLPFLSELTSTITGGVVGGGGVGGADRMPNNRESSQRSTYEQDTHARAARKAQLLRIAKGDLRWPSQTNDEALDRPDPAHCPIQHRLITPPARLLVAKLLRRDATKRATAWEAWDEHWMTHGSFKGHESSAQGQPFHPLFDPRSHEGQAWLNGHARVHAGAPDVVHDD